MSESKHTPVPWKVQALIPDGVIIRKPGWEITTPNYDVCCNIERGAPIRKEEDAHFIALACNEHDALVAALEAFVEAWDKSHQLEKTDVALRLARAVLARVEGVRL